MNQDDKEHQNILVYGKPAGTIELRPHPEDILDVDPEVLAVMKARLRGESFDRMYGADERVSKEFLIEVERRKLARIFGSEGELHDAFSSLKNIKEVRQDLAFESVNRELLAEYTSKLSSGEAVDEVDAYRALLFNVDIQPKRQRITRWAERRSLRGDAAIVFDMIVDSYRSSHFDVLGVSKELLQLQKPLRDFLSGGKLLPAVDEILAVFYKEAA